MTNLLERGDGRVKPGHDGQDEAGARHKGNNEALARHDGASRHYAVAFRLSPFFTASSIVPTM